MEAEAQAQTQAPAEDEFRDPRLITGEDIVFRTSKHWLAPVADSFTAVLLIIASLILAWLQTGETTGIIGFFNRVLGLLEVVLMLGGIGWIVYNLIAWKSATFAVTNQRILCEDGLLRKRSTDTLLASVTDVKMRQSALGKQLGYGDIQIFGSSGEAGADRFTTVRAADEFKKQVLEQKVKQASAPAPAVMQVPQVAAVPQLSPQAEIMATIASLANLRDHGAITPDEYESKKTELLARL